MSTFLLLVSTLSFKVSTFGVLLSTHSPLFSIPVLFFLTLSSKSRAALVGAVLHKVKPLQQWATKELKN